MKTIIFAGEGKLGEVCLKAIQKNFEVVHIVKANNENVLKLKRERDLCISKFNDSQCEHVFLAGWHPLIFAEEIEQKKYINIHGSLLPKYRGLHSIYWAIMNGERELGYTIHEINEKIDDGNIIYQYRFPYKNYTVGEIHELFYCDLTENLGRILSQYMDGKIDVRKQQFEEATWVPRRNLDDCFIDYTMSNELLRRFFLALTKPYPLPRICYKNEIYEVIESEVLDKDYYCQIGRVVNSDISGVWVKTKDGLLILKTLRSVESGAVIKANHLIGIGYRFL